MFSYIEAENTEHHKDLLCFPPQCMKTPKEHIKKHKKHIKTILNKYITPREHIKTGFSDLDGAGSPGDGCQTPLVWTPPDLKNLCVLYVLLVYTCC